MSCPAREYDILGRRIAELEETYEVKAESREPDERDDLLRLRRRQHEMDIQAVWHYKQLTDATHPVGSAATPLDRGDLAARLDRLEARVTALEGAFFALVDRVIDELVGLTNAVVRRERHGRN